MALGSLLAKVGLGKKKASPEGEEDAQDAPEKSKAAAKKTAATPEKTKATPEKTKATPEKTKAAAGKTEAAEADDESEAHEAGVASWKDKIRRLPKAALIGAVAGGGLLIVGLGGAGLWLAFGGKSEKGMAIAQAPAKPGAAPSGGLSPPKGGGTLNEVAQSGSESAPPQASAATASTPAQAPSGGGSLNAVAQATQGPGSGVMVAAAMAAAFSRLPDTTPGQPLPSAPDPQLIEQGSQGALPKIGKDGRKAWQVYARPADVRDDRPRVAVIVVGMGLSRAATMAAIGKLPPAVALAFDPYASDLNEWMIRARRAGHEVYVAVPMESGRFPQEDPGPHALQTDAKPEENVKRLEFVLSRFGGYVGAVTVMGSKFKTTEEQLRPVLNILKARGLMFVDGGGTEGSIAPKVAREVGVPRAASDVYIDAHTPRSAIDLKFTEAESFARQRSVTVLSVEANPANLERLAAWLPTLDGKRMGLTSVSSVADKQPSP